MEARGNIHVPRGRTTVHVKQEGGWARKAVWRVLENIKLLAPVVIRTPGHPVS
jgi:hypothetical protein